jgi:hypothetical protein
MKGLEIRITKETKTVRPLLLLTEINAVYCDKYKKFTNRFLVQNKTLN